MPRDNLGHPGMSYQTTLSKSQVPRSPEATKDISGCLTNMTTKVSGPKIPRSPGTTWDFLGCPTRQDYSSGITWDILRCPTRLDYQSHRSKDPKKSLDNPGHSRISQDVLPDLTTKVPGPNIPIGTAQDVLPDMPTNVPGP